MTRGMPANKRTRGQGRTADFPRLLGGRLCLHFANTIEGPISPEPEDFLHDYDDLLRWSWHVEAVDDAELESLRKLARATPDRTREVFEQAIRLRQSVDRIFRTIAAGGEPRGADLRSVQQRYLEGLGAASSPGSSVAEASNSSALAPSPTSAVQARRRRRSSARCAPGSSATPKWISAKRAGSRRSSSSSVDSQTSRSNSGGGVGGSTNRLGWILTPAASPAYSVPSPST